DSLEDLPDPDGGSTEITPLLSGEPLDHPSGLPSLNIPALAASPELLLPHNLVSSYPPFHLTIPPPGDSSSFLLTLVIAFFTNGIVTFTVCSCAKPATKFK